MQFYIVTYLNISFAAMCTDTDTFKTLLLLLLSASFFFFWGGVCVLLSALLKKVIIVKQQSRGIFFFLFVLNPRSRFLGSAYGTGSFFNLRRCDARDEMEEEDVDVVEFTSWDGGSRSGSLTHNSHSLSHSFTGVKKVISR